MLKLTKIPLLFFLVSIIFYSCQKDDFSNSKTSKLEKAHTLCGHDVIDQRHRESSVNSRIDPCDAGDLSICVEGCSQELVRSVRDAIAEFNAIPNSIINMRIDCNDPDGVDIKLSCSDILNENECVAGTAGSSQVQIVNDYAEVVSNCCPDLNLTQAEVNCGIQGNIMHELMHILGFGHTNNVNDTYIPGTLVNDPLSIVNMGSCEAADRCALSAGDLLALSLWFPEEARCDCPELLPDPCDCPELINEPCDCPEAFPNEVEVTCYCECIAEATEFNPNGSYSKVKIPCNESCDPPQFKEYFSCNVIVECREKETPVIIQGAECFCKCIDEAGEETTYNVRCNRDCDTEGYVSCEKFYR